MNRKMRAKINNATAKQKRIRKETKPTCDECGGELVPVLVIPLTPVKQETLH
jgi:hypothetical protein